MLTRQELDNAISHEHLIWSGALRNNTLLGSLGGPLQEMATEGAPIDPCNAASLQSLYMPLRGTWDRYEIQPGQCLLAQLKESLAMPQSCVGYISSLSHVARFGLQIHVSSPWIEPAFGQGGTGAVLTLELVNHSPRPLLLSAGMPVAKIRLFRVPIDDGLRPDEGFYGGFGVLASSYAVEYGNH